MKFCWNSLFFKVRICYYKNVNNCNYNPIKIKQKGVINILQLSKLKNKKKYSIYFIFSLILLLIPINIYILGDFLGAGFQCPFFRFQETYLGSSLISIIMDFTYVMIGVYKDRSAVSVLLWILADLFLICASILLFLNQSLMKNALKKASYLLFFAGFCFIGSILFQYGPYLTGSAGVAIPIGIPILFVIGGWMYIEGRQEEARDEEEEVQEDW